MIWNPYHYETIQPQEFLGTSSIFIRKTTGGTKSVHKYLSGNSFKNYSKPYMKLK